MMDLATVRTRILIISDTHCAPLDDASGPTFTSSSQSPFRSPLPAADILIHCGDLTYTGRPAEYHQCLDMLRQIQAPVKLVIPGNHDLSLDRDFVFSHLHSQSLTQDQAELHVQQMRDLWTSPRGRAKQEGITFLDEGVHRIDLPNGATLSLYATPYTPEFKDWGFPYERNEDRFNPSPLTLSDVKNISSSPIPSFDASSPSPIDIIISHGPPWHRLDQTNTGDFAGCPHLLRALMRARPLLHCFGHIHEGWGAERLSWSSDVEAVVTRQMGTLQEWSEDGWKEGFEEITRVNVSLEDARERRGAYVDVSEKGGQALRRGKETLLVNAAIMDVEYRPMNAPFVIDLDLPRTQLMI